MKKRKLVKENFYLFLLAALIGILCNYFVSKAMYADKPAIQESKILQVFDLPTHRS